MKHVPQTTTVHPLILTVVCLAALGWPAAALAGPDVAAVRVTRLGPARLALDVADDTVTVRKEISADASVVTIVTPTDRLTLTVRGGALTVTGPGGSMSLDGHSGEAYDRLLVVLQRSEAASRARALLQRVSEGADTFVGQSLLLTRALLETGTGTTAAFTQHQQWVAARAAALAAATNVVTPGGPAVVPIAWQKGDSDRGPGECWDIYSAEAIRIADDFAECVDGLAWYEAHLWGGCALIYTVRSEAAMFWFISCSGGFPVGK